MPSGALANYPRSHVVFDWNVSIAGHQFDRRWRVAGHGGVVVHDHSTRSLMVSGYVDTSAARITTTVNQNFAFTNDQVCNLVNFRENVRGTEVINSATTVSDATGTTVNNVTDSYPITLASAFVVPNHGSASFFALPATVSQNLERTKSVVTNGTATFSDSLEGGVHASAVLVGGSQSVENGSDSEDYVIGIRADTASITT